MKYIFIQIKGLILNLFLVFIFISYNKLDEISSSRSLETLKRIVLILIFLYIIFNLQFLFTTSHINLPLNLSLMDGKIKLTEFNMSLMLFIFIIGAIIIRTQMINNLTHEKVNKKEKMLILLTNMLGISCLIISNDWILTIVSWELFNMSLYLLVSLKSSSEAGIAASLKYFLLSALSTAFLLLGVYLLYVKTGSTNYEKIDTCIRELLKNGNKMQIELGFCLILFTLLFKISAAPFYQWAPDLYENIETNTTMWMIIIPKLSVLTFLLFLSNSFSLFLQFPSVQWILLITGTLSLLIGSIALNNQWYIKRFFAFSGISHIGFMLLALYSLDSQGYIFYMLIYGITTVNIFIIIIILSQFYGRDLKMIQDLAGMFKLNPFISLAFAINLFSLSGVCLNIFYL